MKALRTDAPGGWDRTSLVDLPDPHPGDGEVLVEIKAVGLNPADDFQVRGMYPGGPQPPFVPGRDMAGVIVGGDTVEEMPPGTRVVALQCRERDLSRGTLATRQVFAAAALAPFPEEWSWTEAAGAALVSQTAAACLEACGTEPAGESAVVVTGASGGVGTAAVVLAKGQGKRVVALSRSEEKRRKLLELGADFAFDPEAANLKDHVREAAGELPTVAVDTVGGPMVARCVSLLTEGGAVAVVGVLAGTDMTVSIPSLMFRNAAIHGVIVGREGGASQRSSVWPYIVDYYRTQDRKPLVDSVFPLADYAAAFEKLRGDTFGKVVVEMP